MVGTTVQAGDEVPAAFRAAFSGVGVDLSDDVVSAVRGRSKKEAIADLVERMLPDVEDPAETASGIYSTFVSVLGARYETRARPVRGAAATIGRLKGLGAKVVLTTGLDRATTDRLMQGLGWGSVGVDGVLTGDDVDRGRPAPDLIHAAMRLVGETRSDAVLAVGDTTADLEAAANAEVGWNVGVLTGAHTRAQLEACPHSVILADVARIPGWLSVHA